MTQKLFGTDGVRGLANQWPMTADFALKLAMAASVAMAQNNGGLHTRRVVIGKDTRLSGYMLEQAMAAGFAAMGMEVILVGPVPTPAIAMLTRSLRADAGVMVSASHNPYQDNGIKLFGPDGYKLNDRIEAAIETLMQGDLNAALPDADAIGKATRLEDAGGRYGEYIKSSLGRRQSFDGLKVVVDCAHGAAYKIAPQVLWELEADVVAMNVQPNGRNINDHCGATDTAALQARVVEERADLGLAFDGDADRLIVVDEQGSRVDGDQIMALLATSLHAAGHLQGNGVVATVMSNLGLERHLAAKGIALHRTPVGDRHVVERMKAAGFNFGGEQSGHIIMTDYGTTGDGLLTALQVLVAIKRARQKASRTLKLFDPLPQLLKNVRFGAGAPLQDDRVKSVIAAAERRLGGQGRLLVRLSGTEPMVRVMAEGSDETLVRTVVDDVCASIAAAV